jgi:uncharacterized protein (DUF779 family)
VNAAREAVGTVGATDRALAVLAALRAEHGELMLVVSGGCCEGSAPVCLRAGELLLGPGDLRIGEVGGVDVYIDREQYRRWNAPDLVIDAAPGPSDGLSLEGPAGVHFLIRGPGGGDAGCS